MRQNRVGTKVKLVKLNILKAAVSFFNMVLSLAFFFGLRRALLRMTGSHVGSATTIHRRVLFFSFAKLFIGNNCTVNYGCYIDNRAGIRIGNNVNISHHTKIYTLGHDIDDPMSATVGKPVVIKDDVWIFPSVMIMPGVTIGKGAVVYPGSIVTGDVADYSIVGGSPARHIRFRDENILYSASFPVWFGL